MNPEPRQRVPLEVKPVLAVDHLRLGQDAELTFRITNPLRGFGTWFVRGVSTELAVHLSDDLVLPHEGIAPGETLVLTTQVRIDDPGCEAIDLQQLFIEVEGPASASVPMSSRPRELSVKPWLRGALKPTLTPLVEYPGGAVKVRLTLQPPTLERLERLDLAVLSHDTLQSGKFHTVLAPPPSEPWDTELVVSGDTLVLLLRGQLASGDDVQERIELPVPAARARPAPFAFLEARDLERHTVELYRVGADVERIEPGLDNVFDVRAGHTVELRIKPRATSAAVVVDPVGGRIRVRPQEPRPDLEGWFLFHLDVEPTRTVWYRRERVAFQVQSPDARSFGEIHLSLEPEAGRRWRAAVAVGSAFVANAIVEFGRLLSGPDAIDSLAELREVVSAEPLLGVELAGILAIPAFAFGAWGLGRLRRALERR